jgi:hypothetical protein
MPGGNSLKMGVQLGVPRPWKTLSTKGELSLSQLKKATKGKPPIFDWAIGRLAREDKIVITPE